MDIDFHFGTVYVLSRWAGFEEDTSKAIAAASQFVDDNTPENVPNNGYRISGHQPWSNATDFKDDDAVWIPFHFLPGLVGDTVDDKMVCHADNEGESLLASSLAERMVTFDTTANYGIMQLGISLHVYADTWAHREFCGRLSEHNKVSNPKVLFPTESNEDKWEDDLINKLPPLGHAQAIHWPDRPYAAWQCTPFFPTGRKNWEDFVVASQALYRILAKLSKTAPEELSLDQQSLLSTAFHSIQDDDCQKRNNYWVEKIKAGDFGFTDSTPLVNYMPGFITEDADFCPAFYNALDAHYDWVKEQLSGTYSLG